MHAKSPLHASCLHVCTHALTVVGMETLRTVQDDVSALRDFTSQVRALCAKLMANPFNTPAAEELLDLLLEDAPATDLALERVLEAVIDGPASNGVQLLDMLVGRCRYAAPNAPLVVGAAA